jgi:hypothetical protein
LLDLGPDLLKPFTSPMKRAIYQRAHELVTPDPHYRVIGPQVGVHRRRALSPYACRLLSP